MNYIGKDKDNKKLQVGDICNFKIDNKDYEGIIIYDEESYAFAFEMQSDCFPMVLMSKADFGSISKIINVSETKINDKYEFYRTIYNKM